MAALDVGFEEGIASASTLVRLFNTLIDGQGKARHELLTEE